MANSNIVFVDSNEVIRTAAARRLTAAGHTVRQVAFAEFAMERLRNSANDLIVIDFDLPDILGLDMLTELRSNPDFGPIRVIMTSGRTDNDVVSALESGADDFLSKPYSLDELSARVDAALRRPANCQNDLVPSVAGSISIDDVRHQVEINNDPIRLSPLEYSLLQFLVDHRDRMFTRQELLTYVWKNARGISERTVDVNVRRLRSRLAPYKCESYIQTVRGSGYRFSVMESRSGRIASSCP
ncbi:MAG: response regulator transcription factor [Gammaproteobacteria bacterium]